MKAIIIFGLFFAVLCAESLAKPMRVGYKKINKRSGITNMIENQQLLTMQAIIDRREQLGFNNACLASVERSLLSATREAAYGIIGCNEGGSPELDAVKEMIEPSNVDECIGVVERGYVAKAIRLEGHSTLCI